MRSASLHTDTAPLFVTPPYLYLNDLRKPGVLQLCAALVRVKQGRDKGRYKPREHTLTKGWLQGLGTILCP